MAASAQELVFAFLKRCETDYPTTVQAFKDCLADDFRWVQCGFPTCEGIDEALGLMGKFREATGYASWITETKAYAERDNTVLVERIDHLRNDAGEVFISVPIVGVFHVHGGKITEWHEYPDLAALGMATPFAVPA